VTVRQPERVGIGEYVVGTRQEAPDGLAIHGLASCVAVFIHRSGARLGGLAHILAPEPPCDPPPSGGGAFADIAIPAMVEALRGGGSYGRTLLADLASGAVRITSLRREMKEL